MTTYEFVEKEINAMKEDLKELVSHNSVFAQDELPFGSENRKVLDAALKMMERECLKTKNLDYYCGYGEVGEGEDIIGIVGHIDVVPAPLEGWNTNPFEMVEKDGVLYGRGVSDDKSGVVASLYAIKYLLESGYKFKKRVRLITGCNEETGSACMKHYVECEGQNVKMGYTPDADFPGIFAEKGCIDGDILNTNSKIIDIKGGEATNIVNKRVEAILPNNSFDEAKFEAFLKENEIEYTLSHEDNISVVVNGIAAHGSLPEKGKNAVSYLMEALYVAGFNDPLTDFYHEFIALNVHGELLGCEELTDKYTNLSFNIGIVHKDEKGIHMSVDARFPVTRDYKTALPYLEKMKSADTNFYVKKHVEPLFYDIESPMIKALTKAYADVTGDKESKMEAIGGGTYAKSINGIVPFGCCFRGEDGDIHSPNEYLPVESFKKQVLCYVEAIKNLNELEEA